MLFIIWTIGWFVAMESMNFLGKIERHIIKKEPVSEEMSGPEAFASLIMISIWIMGMIKFWSR